MTDRTRVTWFLTAFIVALAAILAAATVASAGVWYQSYGRVSADAVCEDGWYPSWAQWPNDGTGGWVCDREVDDPSVPVPVVASSGSGGGSGPVGPTLPTAWGSIAGGSMFLAVGNSTPMGVAPPCSTGTLEIRVTSPLTVSLSGPVPQAVTVTNPAVLGAVDFSGAFSVDTRCV